MLHSVETGKWCGPSALTLLTGVPYPQTKSLLSFIREEKYSEFDEVHDSEMILALNNMGYGTAQIDLRDRYSQAPTLQRYMRERPISEKVEPTLISIYKHMVVGHFDYLADNWQPKPTHFTDFPKPRRLVESVFIIRKRITS